MNAQAALVLSRTNLVGELLHLLPLHVFWKDKQGVYQGCNDIFAQRLGFICSDEIIGKTDYDLPVEKEISDLYRQDDLFVMESKQSKLNIEEEQIFADGRQEFLLTNKVPLLDDAGEAVGVLGVYIDITDRKRMEQELLAAKHIAETANRAKTEFLSNISHDVVTPLVSINLMSQIMIEKTDEAKEIDNLNIIAGCAQRLLSFFKDCLESSTVELSAWTAKSSVFSMERILSDIEALFAPTAKTKGLELTVSFDPYLPKKLKGYRTSIHRVILNLVGNALKFTPQGSIQVRAFLVETISSDQILLGIEVKDTGVGIPEDKQGIIFEKLQRLTPAYEGKIDGKGLGLFIVDQYVKRMGGSIQVESVVGEGSAFTVLLPMMLGHAAL